MPQIDPDMPWFTQKEFVTVISPAIDAPTFQLWLQRGYIDIQDKKPGRGNIRKLSFSECAAISTFSFLLQAGERPPWAWRVCRAVAKRAAEVANARNWDLGSWETDDANPFLVFAMNVRMPAKGKIKDADILGCLCKASDSLEEVRRKLGGEYSRILDIDYLIWRTWLEIDQELPNDRVPWRIGQPEPAPDAAASDENGIPIDPNHPWNREGDK